MSGDSIVLREMFVTVLAFAAFASAVAAYLFAFHDEVSVKEVVSTAFAGTIGVLVGRYTERRARHG